MWWCLSTGGSTSTGLATGAIIAIAVVGGIVLLVLATIIFCCCRTRWHSRAAAVEAAAVAKAQPPKQPMTPTMPEPFAVNYPQFSVRSLWWSEVRDWRVRAARLEMLSIKLNCLWSWSHAKSHDIGDMQWQSWKLSELWALISCRELLRAVITWP